MTQESGLGTLDFGQLRSITLDDRTLMRELIGELVSDASRQIEELSRAVERADSRECARLAHGLTGACGNIGASNLATLFYSLEREAATGNVRRCGPHVDCLRNELEKLRRAANSLFERQL